MRWVRDPVPYARVRRVQRDQDPRVGCASPPLTKRHAAEASRPYFPSSAISISLLGRVPRAFASRRIVLAVGFRTPRSMPLT